MSTGAWQWPRKIMKATLLVLGALLTMGNQKCEQEVKVRELKKIVDLTTIRSSPLHFPNNTAFDFQFVVNEQIYGVLAASDSFAVKYLPPISKPPQMARSGDLAFYNLSEADGIMMKAFTQQAGKENFNAQYSQTAWCMVNEPQVKLAGAINSFEMIGGGGVKIGFTPGGAIPTNGISDVGINVEWAQLDMTMVALRPLTSKVVSGANITSKQTKTRVRFGLNFGSFSVGPSAYYQTPLAQVTKNALAKALDLLGADLKKEEWYTRVLANHDSHLVVVGGADVNLEVGDQLLVYNEEYYWEGEPCNSRYLGGGAQAGSAVAKIQIDWVGDEISRGRVIEQNDFNAVIGAKAKLYKFRAPDYQPEEPGVENYRPGASSEVVASEKPRRR